MFTIKELSSKFSSYLQNQSFNRDPVTLYDPVHYIFSLGGKRIRPCLLLASYNMYSEDIHHAFPAAMAVEAFHNFSLIHDDIMDDANLRRGKQTTHLVFGENQAILSGDALLILCYKILEDYNNPVFTELVHEFSDMAIKVCEGQQYDIDFETKRDISIREYLHMINYKTAVLLGSAIKMGGILGNATEKDLSHLFSFGENLGLAFQIQDDILDTYGDQENFGKKIGGDIVQGKKTYLFIKTLELLSDREKLNFLQIFNSKEIAIDEKNIWCNCSKMNN